jgi:hypothetical protein
VLGLYFLGSQYKPETPQSSVRESATDGSVAWTTELLADATNASVNAASVAAA